MNNKDKTIKYLENMKKRAEKMVDKNNTYYCQVCKKAVAKRVLVSDGSMPYEDISQNVMIGLNDFICMDCYKNE